MRRALKDARDLVVLAVGGSYLQVAAAKQRVLSEQAQLDTATALFNQASQQRGVGLLAQTDREQKPHSDAHRTGEVGDT